MKMLKNVFFTLLTIVFFISCKKELSYEGGSVNITNGTWQFQNGSTQYIGDIDSAFIQDVNGTNVLIITGRSLVGQQNFRITLNTADSFTTTTYLSSLSQSEFDYSTSTKTIFTGDFLGGEFTVNITSLSNNNITGTFYGVVTDSTNSQTQINLGTFTSSIDLSNNGNTSGGGTQSVGTLGANPDTCSPSIVSGTYTTGIPLTISNTVQVEVNVTTPGTFIIATNSVNGVNFFKAGSFTTTGVQSVILTGSGTPQIEGLQNFTVTYGNSDCTFEVNFLPGTAPIGDYQPASLNSNWTYGLDGTTDSVLAQVIPYAPTIGAEVYTTFVLDNVPPSGSPDTTFFRKSGNDYFNYIDVSDIFQFDDPVRGEYVFLNDAVPAGTTIRSPDFNGAISGIPATGYIQVTISEKAVPATIGVLDFNDVIKVTYEYYLTVLPGTPIFTEERWFARGVGLVYDNFDDTYILNIGRYQVQ